MMKRTGKYWHPLPCALLMTILAIPTFMVFDAFFPFDRFFAAPVPEPPLLQAAVQTMQERAPLVSDIRFYWYKLFLLGLMAGIVCSALLMVLFRKLPLVSLRGKQWLDLAIDHLAVPCIGGFLMFFGVSLCVPERFDYWLIISGLMQMDTASYLVILSAFMGSAVIGWALGKGDDA